MKIVVMARQKARGKRQEARGKSEKGLGDFTFLYTVWFYCVHLLTPIIKNPHHLLKINLLNLDNH